GATRSVSRTTRLTVIDDTPANLATAERVGAERDSLGSAGFILVSLPESPLGKKMSAPCARSMTALTLPESEPKRAMITLSFPATQRKKIRGTRQAMAPARQGEAHDDFGTGCAGLQARRRGPTFWARRPLPRCA